MATNVQVLPFLVAALDQEGPAERPHVTLTFAQSLDGKIAGGGGQQLILSGKESMIMTHWMRTLHDGIMIGIGTALNDDPQLNARLLPPVQSLPRPIILDTHLRLSPSCKLLRNYQANTGRRPWVVCSPPSNSDDDRISWQHRHDILAQAGVSVIQIESSEYPLLPIPAVLQQLRLLGIKSLMVEGGARVINSFLSIQATPVVDNLIVTVAPTLVGPEGVGYGTTLTEMPLLKHLGTLVVGKDAVMTFQLQQS